LKILNHGFHLAALFIFLVLVIEYSFCQDTTKSLAFKNNRPIRRSTLFYQPDLSYQIWQQFNLIREANRGNIIAQHELGIRYLLGDGVAADTVEGAFWIRKAADKELAAACYNYGILLMNGWGVNWNPKLAFNYFLKAAENGMAQSQHLVGLFYTEDLIVERNWNEAFKWIKKSADSGYEPAKESIAEFKKKLPHFSLDTTQNNSLSSLNQFTGRQDTTTKNSSLNSSLGLVFIDFDAIIDTIGEVTDSMLLDDLLNTGDEKVVTQFGLNKERKSSLSLDSLNFSFLLETAEAGCPESLVLLGRLYEEGKYFPRNLIIAFSYYIRAIRLDSPTAKRILWNLIPIHRDFQDTLKVLISQKNPEARFVWYGLHAFGFDNSIASEDALRLLQQSASQNFLPAIIELGLCNYTGKFLIEDKNKAIEIWEIAEQLGNIEAKVRLVSSKIFDEESSEDINESIKILNDAEMKGSILAQVTLAYCYENGIGVTKNLAEASRYYRYAAQRGSQYAYKELKRLYDSI